MPPDAPVAPDAPTVPNASDAPTVPNASETTALVGVPDNALADVKALIPSGGDAGLATVLLAAIGVAGGGAAWKFYSQHSKNKHEQRMKELELQAEVQSKDEDKHRKCSTERAALEAKVTALEARLAVAEGSAHAPFDPSDLEGRLLRLEAKARRSKTVQKKTASRRGTGRRRSSR